MAFSRLSLRAASEGHLGPGNRVAFARPAQVEFTGGDTSALWPNSALLGLASQRTESVKRLSSIRRGSAGCSWRACSAVVICCSGLQHKSEEVEARGGYLFRLVPRSEIAACLSSRPVK